MSKVPRNRSLKFEDHQGLLHREAKKYHARLLGAQISSVDFDDVIGELSIAFVKATQGYDPEAGFTFTAYIQVCWQRHFNKFAARLMREQYGSESQRDLDGEPTHMGLGYISVQDMAADDAGDIYESMADEDAASPEDTVDAKMTIRNLLADRSLSAATRTYVAKLIDPTVPLSDVAKSRIRANAATIRAELMDRYGVQLNTVRV